MNLTRESAPHAPELVPGSRDPGRSRGPQCGTGKHVRDHARHDLYARHDLVGQIHDVIGDVRHSQEEWRHPPRHRHRVRDVVVVEHDVDAQAADRLGDECGRSRRSRSSMRPTTARSPRPTNWEITQTSAVLVDCEGSRSGTATANYSVQVEGLEGTTGTYLVGFYLPGDVAGSRSGHAGRLEDDQGRQGNDRGEFQLQFRRRRQSRRHHQRPGPEACQGRSRRLDRGQPGRLGEP